MGVFMAILWCDTAVNGCDFKTFVAMVPTLVIVAHAPACLYISAQYFNKSSPKLDLILIINILESSLVPPLSLISYISHSELSLATLEPLYLFKYLPSVHS